MMTWDMWSLYQHDRAVLLTTFRTSHWRRLKQSSIPPCSCTHEGFESNSLACLQGSATLSMAYAGALFGDACLRALNGEPDVAEYAYVESDVVPELSFFSTKVKLGPEGELQPCRAPRLLQKVKCECSTSSCAGSCIM